MKATELKTIILEAIPALLGVYTLPSTTKTFPAIWIGTPDINFKCRGLEVILSDLPQFASLGLQIRMEKWCIYLIQHEAQVQNLVTASLKLQNILVPSTLRFIPQFKSKDIEVLPTVELTYDVRCL